MKNIHGKVSLKTYIKSQMGRLPNGFVLLLRSENITDAETAVAFLLRSVFLRRY